MGAQESIDEEARAPFPPHLTEHFNGDPPADSPSWASYTEDPLEKKKGWVPKLADGKRGLKAYAASEQLAERYEHPKNGDITEFLRETQTLAQKARQFADHWWDQASEKERAVAYKVIEIERSIMCSYFVQVDILHKAMESGKCYTLAEIQQVKDVLNIRLESNNYKNCLVILNKSTFLEQLDTLHLQLKLPKIPSMDLAKPWKRK